MTAAILNQFEIDLYNCSYTSPPEEPQKANFRFYQDPVLPNNSINVAVDGKNKVVFSVFTDGTPVMLYLSEKDNRHHVLNLKTGEFTFLNGKICGQG
jgi:hypothetical protein